MQAIARVAQPLSRAAALHPPRSAVGAVRTLSTDASLAAVPAKEAPAALVAPPSTPSVVTPLPTSKRGSSLVDRLWAFFAGVGVGGVAAYFKLSEDILESTVEIDTRVLGLRTDVAAANEELRRRVATLEHSLQDVKDKLQ